MSPRLRLAGMVLIGFLVGLLVGGRYGVTLPLSSYRVVAISFGDSVTSPDVAPPAIVATTSGSFLILTNEGKYQEISPGVDFIDQVFATLAHADDWAASYDAPNPSGRTLRVTLVGDTTRTIDIAAPDTNLTVPRDLSAFVTTLRRVAIASVQSGTPVTDFSLRAKAAKMTPPSGAKVDPLPNDVTFADLNGPIARDSKLNLAWHCYDLISVGNSRYVKDASGDVWLVWWQLDLGAL